MQVIVCEEFCLFEELQLGNIKRIYFTLPQDTISFIYYFRQGQESCLYSTASGLTVGPT
jgi:hypothetical protein